MDNLVAYNGLRLGPYLLVEEVGCGGLGRVFRAIDERSGRTVAVKILHSKFSNNRKFLGLFHRELLIISHLHHKNIVSYLDGGFQPPMCYLVTDFIEGLSGYALMKRVGRLPPLVALCIMLDVLQGLDHLHLHDTVHSDLSSPNILIDKYGRGLVTDFGLACEQDVENYKNYMVGTPGYYSPEHITDTPITPQSDLYCVGLILYEMITGTRAVPALSNKNQILEIMQHINFRNVVCSERKMTHMIQKVLVYALSFSTRRRAQTADQLMLSLYVILKHYGIRYGRYAVLQYLIDKGLTDVRANFPAQNIYRGFWTPNQ